MAYVIPFETQAQRRGIFELLKQYNTLAPHAHTADFVRHDPAAAFEQLAVGAPFDEASVVTLKSERVCASPHEGPALPRAVLVTQRREDEGKTDGRAATATYLRWHLMRLFPLFVDGEYAIDLYGVNESVRQRLDMASARRVDRDRFWPSGDEAAAAATARAQPRLASLTTMFHCINPEWLALLDGLDKAQRRARVLSERAVPPRLAAYSTLTVVDADVAHFSSARDAAIAADRAAARKQKREALARGGNGHLLDTDEEE